MNIISNRPFAINKTMTKYLVTVYSSPGSRLWNGQVRHGYRRHVGDEARAHHEVHHPRGHGWYHCHLRARGGCPDRRFPGLPG